MRTIGVFEAKTHLSGLLDEVATGQTIVITRNGTPIAELRPIGARAPMSVKEAVERIRQGPKIRLEPGEDPSTFVRSLIEEGRRF
ncbi:MAG: type II toxin-antitoxin system prevent-host-death family antitoxin [Candidatus Baltobacteraceae bacterium]|jgi:prevent-host-death family protein